MISCISSLNSMCQDDPTLVLKKHGGWALGKTAPLLTKKALLEER